VERSQEWIVKAHLVGGGIASLAAAAWLIRDAGFLAGNIRVYEAGDGLGGAMAMAGGPDAGYILPTGRVFEAQYRCAFDLFSMVPSVSDPKISIKDEILAFNQRYGYFDRAHVVDHDLKIVRSAHFGLSAEDRLALLRLAVAPEAKLEGVRIEECFSEAFFSSEFWFLWAPLMGPLRQHSALEMRRFINRFLHLTADLSTMTMVYRTRYNQYDSIVRPIVEWLRRQGVEFVTGATVTDVEFAPSRDEITAVALKYEHGDVATTVEVGRDDIVLVTNGSQTSDLCVGSMKEPPNLALTGRSFSLWEKLARNRPEFGRPDVFFGEARVPDTKWCTFTVTTRDATFFELMSKLSGSEPGRGGFMTLRDSPWLLTLAIFHQPEFVGQPPDVMAWWGFGMRPDLAGAFVSKPMAACNGAEILDEVLHHLKFDAERAAIIERSTCIPCVLPYANSVWMPRSRTDRPLAAPKGSSNFGFIGQFCEIPEDTIFTMEYSVRSARQAVSALLGLPTHIPPVYQGQHDPKALLEAMKALA
jgi:oleate hydratase